MNNREGKNKQNKTKKVSVRFTEREYHLLTKRANKSDIKISDYIRDKCLNNSKEKDSHIEIYVAVKTQDMCNYIREKYNGDKKLESWCKDIWKHLQ